jgi:DNA-binding response OmpR family regulator
VLSVVGEPALANLVELSLRHGTYTTTTAASVAAARMSIETWKPHLLLLNIDVEDGRAIQLVDEAESKGVAVIALTRRADLRGKLDAFERGADDYITVPFVPDDLIARSRAVLRRTHGVPGSVVPRLRIGDLEIDVLNRKVMSGQGHELHLTSLEQALLYLLAANAGTVLTREQILDALWGTDFVIESNVVDRHVRALRAKLQNDWHKPRYIETVAGAGYRFVPKSEPEPSSLTVARHPPEDADTA